MDAPCYIEGNCFLNAYVNKRNYYKSKNLKMVFGSIAFNSFYEYGGKKWTAKDFAKKHEPGSYVWDAHAWLEDADGNVYDKIFPFYNFSAKVNTGSKMRVKNNTVWEGISKAEAQSEGVTFRPADKETQTMIFISLLKHLQDSEKTYLEMKGDGSYNVYDTLFNTGNKSTASSIVDIIRAMGMACV
jgi:hypothetical protein